MSALDYGKEYKSVNCTSRASLLNIYRRKNENLANTKLLSTANSDYNNGGNSSDVVI